MDHALSVRAIESVGDFNRMAKNLIDGQRPADQTRRQGLAVERLHHKERKAILLADVVERTNVRMAQARKRERLAFESLAAGWALGNLWRQDFDRHRRGRAVYRWRDTPRPSHRGRAVPESRIGPIEAVSRASRADPAMRGSSGLRFRQGQRIRHAVDERKRPDSDRIVDLEQRRRREADIPQERAVLAIKVFNRRPSVVDEDSVRGAEIPAVSPARPRHRVHARPGVRRLPG